MSNGERLQQLLNEGTELKSTFTNNINYGGFTTDAQAIGRWLVESMRAIEPLGISGVAGQVHKLFEGYVGKIGNLRLKDFEGLIGNLEGLIPTADDYTHDGIM